MNAHFTYWSFLYVALVAYWTVLAAELVGDKSVYTVSSLALRFNTAVVAVTMSVAFAVKMFSAVLLASVLLRLHAPWLDWLSAGAFFLSAILIWTDEPPDISAQPQPTTRWWRGASISFAALFFTEWADPGQIAAAALTVKSHSILAPWLGGTLAMLTKGVLALTVGLTLRDRIPQRALQTLASVSCGLLGIVALAGAFHHLGS